MNYKIFLLGGLIYVIIAIVLGMIGSFVSMLAFLGPYAVLIAALIAGIYVGRKGTTPTKAAIEGAIAGLIGGVIGGTITMFISPLIPARSGISYLDQAISLLGSFITPYMGAFAALAWFIVFGLILGGVGGFIGSKLRR
jgi:hypothetical protein